ncbi:hypothetical protein NQ314_010596 [Rhamnusium bicolor]|uniref:PiggyBac transposable element-derived protein domain-containing protein n=1 Tax=Rhamnusium bicolor TaxID=1586634 RepID=A0AAV8XP03_9CUCU|nr:hypothetical protein NQ314_010596 [Rhamnusium bicolor]
MNSDSEDDTFDVPNEEQDDGWDNVSDVVFLEDGNENVANNTSDDDSENEVITQRRKKARNDNEAQETITFKLRREDLVPILHDFNDVNSGCQIENLDPNPSALDIFESFITENIVEEILNQTNMFYNLFIQNNPDKALKNHKPPTMDEIYVFLAISLLMPLVKKNGIKDYWSKDIIIEIPIFGQIMSRDRYLFFLRYLHFADNSNPNKDDRLYKIRCIVDHFKSVFKRSFYPFQNIVIDESLLLFKGRLSFRQYIPSKRHRFGVKFFVMVDCETGYILDFIIYTGGTTEIKEIKKSVGKSGNIVLSLTKPYWNKGHHLYTDNWYTSPLLYEFLFHKEINCCGTVKANRQFMPPFQKTKGKGTVHMLTSMHTSAMQMTEISSNKEVEKPTCVIDYNLNMGGVDRTDMLLSTTESVRKTIKWYKKVFFHLLDLAILNSHAVCKMKTGENIPLLEFQKILRKTLIEKYRKVKPRPSGTRPYDGHSPLRLIERHFPSTYPPKPETNKKILKQCIVCAKQGKRKSTTFTCKNCDVALCFERYHTVLKF